jgi:hypothetical protein
LFIFKKVYLLYSRVGVGATGVGATGFAGAVSKFYSEPEPHKSIYLHLEYSIGDEKNIIMKREA